MNLSHHKLYQETAWQNNQPLESRDRFPLWKKKKKKMQIDFSRGHLPASAPLLYLSRTSVYLSQPGLMQYFILSSRGEKDCEV
jgi:hypothetical protein